MVINDVPKRFGHENPTAERAREALYYYRGLMRSVSEEERMLAEEEFKHWGAILKGLEETEDAAG